MWKPIEADITGLPAVTTSQARAGALGAAILVGVGVREFASIYEGIQAPLRWIESTRPTRRT